MIIVWLQSEVINAVNLQKIHAPNPCTIVKSCWLSRLIPSQVRYIVIWICHFKMVWWFLGSLGLNKAVTCCSFSRSLQGPLLKVQSAMGSHLPAARMTDFLCSKCMVRKCLTWDVLDVKKKGHWQECFQDFYDHVRTILEHIVWLVCEQTHAASHTHTHVVQCPSEGLKRFLALEVWRLHTCSWLPIHSWRGV